MIHSAIPLSSFRDLRTALATAKEVPSSIAPPVREETVLPNYTDASKIVAALWENSNHDLNESFRIGKSYYLPENDALYTETISILFRLVMESVKEQIRKNTPNMEIQQQQIQFVTAVFKAIQANIDTLKITELPVDKNAIIALISGYIITCVGDSLKKTKKP